MCGVIGTVASVGFQAVGAMRRAREQRAQYQYQEDMNERNAEIQRQREEDAVSRGAAEASRFRTRVDDFLGQQVAAFAGNNIDVESETARKFLSDTAAEGELDAQIIENNALREAYGYAIQEQRYLDEASLARSNARSAGRAGLLGAATAIGGGVWNNWDELSEHFSLLGPMARPRMGSNISWFSGSRV